MQIAKSLGIFNHLLEHMRSPRYEVRRESNAATIQILILRLLNRQPVAEAHP